MPIIVDFDQMTISCRLFLSEKHLPITWLRSQSNHICELIGKAGHSSITCNGEVTGLLMHLFCEDWSQVKWNCTILRMPGDMMNSLRHLKLGQFAKNRLRFGEGSLLPYKITGKLSISKLKNELTVTVNQSL